MLDTALRRFVSLCASYHGQFPYIYMYSSSHIESYLCLLPEQFLQSPMQLEHACCLLLDSELFAFHSERMCELVIEDVKSVRTPRTMVIIY